jgi:CheY-like chemotaxis protein
MSPPNPPSSRPHPTGRAVRTAENGELKEPALAAAVRAVRRRARGCVALYATVLMRPCNGWYGGVQSSCLFTRPRRVGVPSYGVHCVNRRAGTQDGYVHTFRPSAGSTQDEVCLHALVLLRRCGVELDATMAKTVLAADDDAMMRGMLRDLFRCEQGYDLCQQATNGKEAVEFAVRCKPDLIILDFVMPVMTGIAAAKALKQLMPSVPIILFSWHGEALFREARFLASMVDRIVRKSDTVGLIEQVRTLAPVPEPTRLNFYIQ